MAEEPCPFCEIIAGRAPATIIREWSDALAFVPLNPVVEGHTLVIPKEHVPDFRHDPDVSADTMWRAALLAQKSDQPMNLITSRGPEATQSVFHLQFHLVPRTKGDGLALPWHSGQAEQAIARVRQAVQGFTRGEHPVRAGKTLAGQLAVRVLEALDQEPANCRR